MQMWENFLIGRSNLGNSLFWEITTITTTRESVLLRRRREIGMYEERPRTSCPLRLLVLQGNSSGQKHCDIKSECEKINFCQNCKISLTWESCPVARHPWQGTPLEEEKEESIVWKARRHFPDQIQLLFGEFQYWEHWGQLEEQAAAAVETEVQQQQDETLFGS